MIRYDTHVCLVSAQAAPNLLPILDENLKPKRVILVATPQMREQAQWLSKVIKPRGVKVEIQSIATAVDFAEIQSALLNILAQAESESIALNLTGGTKWMAIASQEVFRGLGKSAFYVNIADDNILFLDKEKTPPHKLSHQINLVSYLQAHGYSIISERKPQGITEALLEFCQQLVLKVTEWENAIGQLNHLASKAEQNNTLRVQIMEDSDVCLSALLSELLNANLLIRSDPKIVQFKDENARSIANGGWLELYVNTRLNKLKSEGVIQDSPQPNLKVRSAKGSENEIDVAFMAKNHLHIIECKTKRLAGAKAGQAGTDAIYKLDSISDLGGLTTRSMLVCYRKLREADRQRAKDLRIKVVEAQEISQLKDKLRDWINRN